MNFTLSGMKTYIVGVLMLIATVAALILKNITVEDYMIVMGFLAGLGVFTMRAAIKKVEK